MPVRLENLTSRPVWLVLASGDALRISPGELSASVADSDVGGSEQVDKLVTRGAIAVRAEGGGKATQRRSAASRRAAEPETTEAPD